MFEGGGGTLRDISGHGLDGAFTGTPEWVQTRDGSGLDFDGTGSEVVTVPDNSLLDITDAITLECWFKPETLTNTAGFVHKQGAYMLYIATGSDRPQFYVYTPSVATTLAPSIPPLGEWCHMVGTYDGATVSLYINGVLVDTTANTGSIATNANDLEIGRYYFSTSTYNYDGVISSVRLWRQALPASAIRDLYVSPWRLYKKALRYAFPSFADLSSGDARVFPLFNEADLNSGDLIYWSATDSEYKRLPIGSTGETLTVSAGGLPVWA
jgi:hypothetical protein